MLTTECRNVPWTLQLICCLFANRDAAALEPPEEYVPQIIRRWEAQKGDNRDTVGFALTVAFINWPSIFLATMDGQPQAFKSWLDSMAGHTHRYAEEPGRGAWVVAQMHTAAAKWQGERYQEMIASIRQVMERLTHPAGD